jgi:hypothetical protein
MTRIKGHIRTLRSGKTTQVVSHERKMREYSSKKKYPSFVRYESVYKQLPSSQIYAPEKGEPPFKPSPAGLALTDIAGNIESQLNVPTHAQMSGIHSDNPIITVDPGANKPFMFDFQFFKPATELDLDRQYNFKTRAVVWNREPHTGSVTTVFAMKTFDKLKKAIEFVKNVCLRS